MDFTNFFFGKRTEEPNPIGQSLRFRGTQYLDRTTTGVATTAGTKTTFSYWFKRSNLNQNLSLFNFFVTQYNNFYPGNNFVLYGGNGSNDSTSTFVLRDTAAWNHVVINSDGVLGSSNHKCWLNGVEVTNMFTSTSGIPDFPSFTNFNNNPNMYIGRNSSGSQFWEGYIADFYAIDGQCLPATVFGNYNENGVWEPRDPEFEVNTQKYSAGVVGGPSGAWYSSTTEPKTMFDGDLSTYCQTTEAVGTITWTPVEPIPYSTGVRFNALNAAGDTVSLNGGAPISHGDGNGFNWKDLVTGSGVIEKIEWTGGYGGTVAAIEVDGQILVDGPRYSNDLYAVNDGSITAPPFDTTLKEFNPSGPKTTADQAFNGNDGDYAGCANPGSWVVYRPSTPINVESKIKFQCNFGASDVYINDVAGQIDITGSQEVFDIDFTGELTHLAIRGLPGSFAGTLIYIEIDGTRLLDGVGLTYGQQGFHLDFSDPNDLGADRSGNGNHFNANGFDTALLTRGYWADSVASFVNGTLPNSQGQPYIIDVDPANGPVGYNYPTNDPQLLFDGRLDTNALYWPTPPENGGNEFTFDLRDYDTIESFEFYSYNWIPSGITDFRVEFLDSNKVVIAGTERSTGGTAGEPQDMAWRSMTVLGDPKYIRFRRVNSADHLQMRAFRINGAILSQTSGTSSLYDLMQDSPTQNYAVWSEEASLKSTNVNIANGSLRVTTVSSTNWAPAYSSFGPFEVGQPGKYYFELNDDDSTGYKTCNFGLTNNYQTSWTAFWWNAGDTLSWYPENGQFYRNGSSSIPTGIANSTSGGKGMAIDFETGTVTAYDYESGDSADLTALSSPLTAGEKYYIVAGVSNGNGTTAPFNFGQQPWIGNPPEGYTGIQTDELPAPPIPNGREHFQALVGPGDGNDGATANQLGGNWSPYLFADNTGDNTSTPDFNSTTPATLAAQAFNGDTSNGADAADASSTLIFRPPSAITATSSLRLFTSNQARVFVNEQEVGSALQGSNGWVDMSSGMTFPIDITSIALNGSSGAGAAGRCNAFEIDGEVLVDFSILAQAQNTFPNGVWWIKDRVNADNHQLLDSVRGGNFVLQPNTAASETSYVPPSGDSVAWCWKAGDTIETDNTGTIESQVCVNHDAGFSIVQWVGDGAFSSIGHGLGKRPGMVMTRTRQADHWIVGVDGVTTLSSGGASDQWINENSFVGTNWQNGLILNSSNAATDYVASSGINLSGNSMMAYVWTPIEGFSSFGTFTGNGNEDGPVIYTGFKPAFVLIKSSNQAQSWIVYDSTQSPHNPVDDYIYANNTAGTATGRDCDFISNGFKIRTTGSVTNFDGYAYLYAAFGENPFQSPVTAR